MLRPKISPSRLREAEELCSGVGRGGLLSQAREENRMSNDPAHDDQYIDPAPLVIDLLVNIAATALSGLLVNVGSTLYSSISWRRQSSNTTFTPSIETLGQRLDELESLVRRAFQLIRSNSRRELGGILLLNHEQMEQYRELRESIFDLLRQVDELTEDLPSQPEDRTETSRPREFRVQVRFIENRLADARVANLAEEAFLEISSALIGMRRLLDQIQRNSRSR